MVFKVAKLATTQGRTQSYKFLSLGSIWWNLCEFETMRSYYFFILDRTSPLSPLLAPFSTVQHARDSVFFRL